MKWWYKKNSNISSGDPFSIKEGDFRYGNLGDFSYRKQWTEEVFYQDAGKKETIGRSFDFSLINYFVVAIVVFLSLLIGRTAYLQIVKGEYYYSMAEGNRIRNERIEAKRGVIYDRQYRPLVRNTANFMLYFVPSDLPRGEAEKAQIFEQIASTTGNRIPVQSINELLAKVKPGSFESLRPLFIADNIPYETAMRLYLAADSMPGVVVSSKTRREYNLYGRSLPHILGYTGKINQEELDKYGEEYLPIDYIGKMGVEYFWENELKGKGGKKEVEVDAMGKEKKILNKTDAEHGHNLALTIDLDVQKKLEDIIIDTMGRSPLKVTKASAVALDPRNGEVLALVSWPAFDNNIFARGISQNEYRSLLENPDNPLFNRAVSGEFPSGSVIKPVMSAAALEEGTIDEHTSFLSNGGIRVGQWFFPDWKAGGHGMTDVRKAIAQSVNTFYYIIGGGYNDFAGLGVDRIGKYFKLFGLGEQTGIDLNGEASGFVPTKEWKEETKGERWYIGDTYHLSIGQGDLLVTPLQVADYTAFFANGGKIYRPHLLRQILTSDDSILANVESKPVREDIIKDYNVRIVREGMRQTVTSGSARSLSDLPVTAAGKTGTAQFSSKKKPHAWFTGFAPYDDSEIVVTILVEEGEEGSRIAVPIAKEFLKWYFTDYKNKSTPKL